MRKNLVTNTLLVAAAFCFSINPVLADPSANSANSNKKKKTNNYNWRNLQSDIPGVARHTDSNLVNPWGIAISNSSTTGAIWVNDNGTGVATVYLPDGTNTGKVVSIPTSSTNTEGANPTGIVRNDTAGFKIIKNANILPGTFIFVSEDGSISGWNAMLDPDNAILAVDNGASGAIYKGVTIAATTTHVVLYVTNFHSRKVEMYDENFNRLDTNSTFVDPSLPAGYAPFGIRNFGNQIFVTYALQDANAEDDVAGAGFGFIDVYDTNGTFIRPAGLKRSAQRAVGPRRWAEQLRQIQRWIVCWQFRGR